MALPSWVSVESVRRDSVTTPDWADFNSERAEATESMALEASFRALIVNSTSLLRFATCKLLEHFLQYFQPLFAHDCLSGDLSQYGVAGRFLVEPLSDYQGLFPRHPEGVMACFWVAVGHEEAHLLAKPPHPLTQAFRVSTRAVVPSVRRTTVSSSFFGPPSEENVSRIMCSRSSTCTGNGSVRAMPASSWSPAPQAMISAAS